MNQQSPEQQPGIVLVEKSQDTSLFNPTPKQKADIDKLSLQYIRENKLVFNSTVVQRTQEILLGDALQRQLKAEGKVGLTPQDNIRKLIQSGLGIRAKVVSEAEQIISQNSNEINSLTGVTKIGPYALDQNLLKSSEQKARNNKVTPDIKDCDALIATVQERSSILPRIAQAILTALPREYFPDASIDRFPTAGDQVKILRNMILSLVFRGNPLPAISVSEFESFYKRLKEKEGEFIAGIFEKVIPTLSNLSGIPTERIVEYLGDLRTQTKELLQQPVPFRSLEETAERDSMYLKFSRYFALLHPALEEAPLVTEPTDRSPDGRSIWDIDLAIPIDGYLIPSTFALEQAIRVTSAKGKSSTRFREGINEWKLYERKRANREKRIGNQEAILRQTQEQLMALREGKLKIPQTWIDAVQSKNVNLNRKLLASAYRIRQYKHHLRLEREARADWDAYLSFLVEKYGNNLPNLLPTPDWIVAESEQARNNKVTRAKNHQNSIETQTEELFIRDFFHFSEFPSIDIFEATDGDLQRLLNGLRLKLSTLSSEDEAIIPFEEFSLLDVENFLAQRILRIDTQIKRRESARERNKSRTHLPLMRPFEEDELNKAKLYIAEIKTLGNADQKGVPRQFYIDSLQKRVAAVEEVLKARRKVTEEKDRRITTEENISKEEMEYRYTLSKAAFPTSFHEDPPGYYFRQLLDYQKALYLRKPGQPLPPIPNTNPYINVEELKKVRTDQVTAVVERLVGRIKAHLYLAAEQKEQEELKKELEVRASELYEHTLEGRVTTARRAIQELQKPSEKTRLIEAMQGLNLTVEIQAS